MKLATIRTTSGDKPVAVLDADTQPQFVDLCQADPTLPASLKELLGDEDGLRRAAMALAQSRVRLPLLEGTPVAPIPDPGKVLCIGLNYRDHAEESGMPIPSEPVCFGKFGNTIIGPGESIVLPAAAREVDYEAELVVVIGRGGKHIAESEALSHVAGYMNGHDVSARDWQVGRPGGQWLLGKSPDTFAPIGPWLVTADEIPDPHSLRIQLRLNGETLQDSNTSQFIFSIEKVIAFVSRLITLEPGDVIFTGTPPGVGMARKPPVYLKPGDTAEVEIAGLGVLSNPVIGEKL